MVDVYKIRTPATVMMAGSTGAGKSFLVKEILSRLGDVFDRPPKMVIYCYSKDQPLYDEMTKTCPIPLTFHEGLPQNFDQISPRTLLIIDDLQTTDSSIGRRITDTFTKHSHHQDMDVIYLVQNLFTNTPHHRTCNLNSQYLIVFKNPRDKLQISCLSRQVFPEDNKFLMTCYKEASARPHGYLFLDLKQGTSDHLRVRDSIFSEEARFFVRDNAGTEFKLPIQS